MFFFFFFFSWCFGFILVFILNGFVGWFNLCCCYFNSFICLFVIALENKYLNIWLLIFCCWIYSLAFLCYWFSVCLLSNVYLPTPKNIDYFWCFGSLLLVWFVVQFVSGFFLSSFYLPSVYFSFDSVDCFYREVLFGSFFRSVHSIGASFFFLFIYFHLFRGLYFSSYSYVSTWLVGCLILVLSMAVAFLGYVLPWGNMSLWGATVITSLLSAIPYFGSSLVEWLWGGFSISSPTLSRFFVLHFFLPFILAIFVFSHILFLHVSGSGNPLGINSKGRSLMFTPYFLINDLLGFVICFIIFLYLVIYVPFFQFDSSNFDEANFLSTPLHIKPEWYFLAAYAVLRCVPNKLGGVYFLFMFFFIYFLIPFLVSSVYIVPLDFFGSIFYFMFICNFVLLTVLGGLPVESPFVSVSAFSSFLYFVYFVLLLDISWLDYISMIRL